MKVNLRSVDLNLLTVFDAIMAEGKLSRAAEKLGMTQSAASSALARLRITFDDELFVRTRQGMVPTHKAQELIQPIRQGLACITDALDPSQEFDPSTSKRAFKMVMGDYGELLLLPALLSIFEQSGKELKIESLSERDNANRELVRKAQVDLLLDYRIPDDEHLEHIEFPGVELVVVAKKNHPRLKGKLSVDDYLRERHLVYSTHQFQLTGLERILETKKRIPRKVLAEVTQISSIPKLVEQTQGIATVPRRVAEYYARNHDIQYFPFPFDVGDMPVYMVWHQALNRDKGHKWLREVITRLMEFA